MNHLLYLFLPLVLLTGCHSTAPCLEPLGPEFHYEGKVTPITPKRQFPWEPKITRLLYQRKGKTIRGSFPADPAFMNEIITHSNFQPTRCMMLSLAGIAFDSINVRCLDGDGYRQRGHTTTIRTVEIMSGASQEIRVTRLPDGRYSFSYGRKRKDAYPDMMVFGD